MQGANPCQIFAYKGAFMNDISIQWFFDYLDSFPKDSPSRIALINMFVAWKKHLEEEEKTRT